MNMEVKVKDGDMLIDATVEVVDGVMLITPKAPLSKKEEEKWTPKHNDEFFMPYCFFGEQTKTVFTATSYRYDSDTYKDIKEWGEYKRGWVFKTKEECQSLCDKLNAAIAYVTL